LEATLRAFAKNFWLESKASFRRASLKDCFSARLWAREGGVLKTESATGHTTTWNLRLHSRQQLLNERRFGEALRCLAHEFAPEAGVEVEFKLFRPQNCAAVRRACLL